MTIEQLTSRWSVRQVSISLTIIALVPWCYSITQAKLDIGFYGLIHSFPITFFIALGILTIASATLWLSKESHQRLLLLQLLILIASLWLVPLLIGSRPFPGDAHRNLELIDAVVQQSHIFHDWYLFWPGAFILFPIVVKLGAVNLQPIMNMSSFFMQLLYLLPLYVFLRNLLGEARINYCWAGLWIFSLVNWIGEGYFSPQGTAYFLLLVLLALITTPSFWERKSKSFVLLSLTVITFATLSITHLLTSLTGLSILAAICVIKRSKRLAPVVAVCFLLIISWDVIGAGGYMTKQIISEPLVTTAGAPTPSKTVPTPSETVPGILTFDPGFLVEQQVAGHLTGNESHIAVVKLRILFSAVLVVLALAGAIFLLVRRKFHIAIPAVVIALAPVVLFPISGYCYQPHFTLRLYFFLLPPMAYFATNLLDIRRKAAISILCLILIVAVPLHVVSHYGNQAIDYESPSNVAGLNYINEVNKGSNYPLAKLNQLSWEDGELLFDDTFPKAEQYFAISQHDDATYDFLYNKPEFVDSVWSWLESSKNYNFIYANPEFHLYVNEANGQ